MSAIHGVRVDAGDVSPELVKSLRDDHMTRFEVVPKTVMVNPPREDIPWLIIDSTYPAQIQKRLDLLNCKRDWIMARMPDDHTRAAEIELRDQVVSTMTTLYPEYFIRNGKNLTSLLSGITVNVGPYGADPLVASLLLASEDLLIMVPDGQDAKGNTLYPLKSGVLAFPNGWSLTSQFNEAAPDLTMNMEIRRQFREARDASLKAARLGLTMHEIHNGRVRHFMENYATRVDMFFSRMDPEAAYWRRNWGPAATYQLFRHADTEVEYEHEPEMIPEFWREHGGVRSEHETFRKLPESGAVIFGIKTYLWPLRDIAANSVALTALRVAFNAMEKNPSMFEYRSESLPSFGQALRLYPA